MIENLLLLWLAALPLMGSPGPATISLAASGSAFGIRPSLGYLGGIITGTTAVLLLVATGIATALLAHPIAGQVLTAIAAIYILYLAWKIATAPIRPAHTTACKSPQTTPEPTPKTTGPDFRGGVMLAIANPKAFAAIGAVYAAHAIAPHSLWLDNALKIAALALVIVLVNSLWLVFGAGFARLLSDPRFGRLINILFAALLIASLAMALLSLS
ncbi:MULTISPECIES: LysE family transporter [Thalassospira]|uniref:LysE family translocator n=1 Tax=Thalassospira TaxID=168934 RepID=UPI0008DCAE4A|nr:MULTISPECIES: LysE family transporter [Thalassospira]MDM7978649.1 LysE family transporter [Thalassospira xiamenensis]OHZ01689.1 amino acid efflux protein [Thalassospira sp. MIT1004]